MNTQTGKTYRGRKSIKDVKSQVSELTKKATSDERKARIKAIGERYIRNIRNSDTYRRVRENGSNNPRTRGVPNIALYNSMAAGKAGDKAMVDASVRMGGSKTRQYSQTRQAISARRRRASGMVGG